MDILVISDNVTERSVIQQALENTNHKITFVKNSGEAASLTKYNHFRFIIADRSEQDEGIGHFVQKIRDNSQQERNAYTLLLVTRNPNEELVSDLASESDDYLYRPIDPQELKARVSVGARIISMSDTLAEAHDQLENLAMYDPLTGLMNRQAFYKVAQGELERARRTSEGVSIIALDIDNFKTINEEHGQSVGDEVIKIVAQIIRDKSRPYDCIGRWAGDQFALTLPGVVSADAVKIVKRIIASVRSSEIRLPSGIGLNVKLNTGIATAQNINAYVEIDTFIQSAVLAMTNNPQDGEDEINIEII